MKHANKFISANDPVVYCPLCDEIVAYYISNGYLYCSFCDEIIDENFIEVVNYENIRKSCNIR